MTWGAVAGAAVGVVGSALTSKGGSSSNGGAGTQTQTKEPWAAAQPWIMNNLARGQELQAAYQNQPFSALQNQAYQNQANQSSYMRSLVPSLLGQLQSQQVGYDRSNPNLRPTAFSFDGVTGGTNGGQGGQSQGLLSMLTSTPTQALDLNANTPQVPKKEAGAFTNYDQNANPMANYYGSFLMPETARMLTDGGDALRSQFMNSQGGAGYGEFKYGMKTPERGTQAWRDMQEYIAYGGNDPYGLYTPLVAPAQRWGTAYGNSGDSVGGSAAADGSGGGGPGAF